MTSGYRPRTLAERFDAFVVKSYLFLFARRSMQPVNQFFLRLSIRGLGYINDSPGPDGSGETQFIDILSRFSPQLCIDVGASWGGYSGRLLRKTSATVFAFEPLPSSYEKAIKVETEFPGRVKVENVALGAQKSRLKLHYGEKTGLATLAPEVNAIDYVGRNNVNTVEVPVITLDEYYRRNLKGKFNQLDFIKIDTEGYEFEVLSGAQQMFCDMPPKFVQIEFNMHHAYRGHPMTKFAGLLPGYRLYQILPYARGLAARNPRSLEASIYEYSNFVFVRGDIDVPTI